MEIRIQLVMNQNQVFMDTMVQTIFFFLNAPVCYTRHTLGMKIEAFVNWH